MQGQIYTTNDGTIVFNGGDGMRPTQGGQIQGVQIGGGSKIYIQQQPHQGIITHVSRYFSNRIHCLRVTLEGNKPCLRFAFKYTHLSSKNINFF